MTRKLYIINNGLKDLRGHYFETSVSIAEASRALGLQPVIAAHVQCPCDIVPTGLEFHAAFTTDHWMTEPPSAQPDLSGLHRHSIRLAANMIDGGIAFTEYLQARFHRQAGSQQGVVAAIDPAVSSSVTRTAEAKRRTLAVLSPWYRRARPILKRMLRSVLPQFVFMPLKALFASFRDRHEQPGSGTSHPWERALSTLGAPQEYGYCLRFQQDLGRLLFLTDCTADDHVFLPTAHARELCAILDLLSNCPVESQPMFHLEFRHSLAAASDGIVTENDYNRSANAAFFEIAHTFPVNKKLRLYTDSDGLTAEYEHFSRLRFGVLPIPFRSHLLGTRREKMVRSVLGITATCAMRRAFTGCPTWSSR